jgi:CDP-diacylglycerol--glycerol-3-phosphate 3-phosphatidyltransferase
MSDRQLLVHTKTGVWPLSWPMGLTMLRLLLLPVFLWVVLRGARPETDEDVYRWIAVAIFVVMAITDKLDGYLARKFDQTSRLGAILDPVADKLLVACSVILLSFPWVAGPDYAMPFLVIVAVYGKDLIVALGTLAVLGLIGSVSIKPRPLGKLSTVLQLSMIVATLIAPDMEKLSRAGIWWLTRSLWWAVCIIAMASATDYVIIGTRQYSEHRRNRQSETGNQK